MNKNIKLTQEQALQQRLTPLQVRYVRMLEMSGPEFEQEVHNALDEMPALDAVPDPGESASRATEDGADFHESADDMQRADYRSEDDIPDYLSRSGSEAGYLSRGMYRTSQASPEDFYTPELSSGAGSLIEDLESQLAELSLSERERLTARYICGSLDDNGYLVRSLTDIADDIALNEGEEFTRKELDDVRRIICTLDPPGIGAVDLRDCLLLQLDRLPRTVASITAREIIREYFDLFAKRHFERIASAIGISRESLSEALEVISHLNPKPASLLDSTSGGAARPVVPDFSVEVDANGKISLTLLSRVPELRIEQSFDLAGLPSEGSAKGLADARLFIKQKRDEASDFIRVVGMRRQTLLTVMSAIIRMQRDFFLSDDESAIRPMVLRQLAEITGLDISVISRATQGKYVATASGVYPLKMFFNEQVKPAEPSGADNTVGHIVAEIRDIIANEDKRHPLSDLKITEILTSRGYDIARRTVAKYREKIGFPVGRLRKSI